MKIQLRCSRCGREASSAAPIISDRYGNKCEDARDCCLEMTRSGQTAKTMADVVTPKQLVAMLSIAHAQRVNAETECLLLLGVRPESLNRRAASAFIDYLKRIDRYVVRRVA